MPATLRDTVSAEIRAEMARRRLTQQALGDALGEGQWWISKRLTGATPFTIEDLERVAQALELPVSHFIREQVAA